MHYKRKGYPDVSELVLCRVTKVLPHAVFARLEEFERLDGLIHISEIAPGRIRNIRDYVKEDKRVVCKVLKIDQKKGHIDLSLRRVGTGLRVKKLHEVKQDDKAEKLLGFIGKKLGKDLPSVYKLFGSAALAEYGRLTPFFEAVVVDGKEVLTSVGLSGKQLDDVYTIITSKISAPSVTLVGHLHLHSLAPDGVAQIRSVLVAAAKKFDCSITYVSAPKYKVSLVASDYKTGEAALLDVVDYVTDSFSGSVEFVRGTS